MRYSQMTQPKYPSGGLPDSLSNLTLSGPQASSSQSRLGLWTDKAPGSRQGANMSSTLHASHSTPNLQGVCFCLKHFCLSVLCFGILELMGLS